VDKGRMSKDILLTGIINTFQNTTRQSRVQRHLWLQGYFFCATMMRPRALLLALISLPHSPILAFGFRTSRPILQKSGGRAPESPDVLSTTTKSADWRPPLPPKPSEAKLTVVQVTDVYTLENFASLKTMIAEIKEQVAPGKVISILTGDFLAPYPLSSIDRGAGMMNALAKIPMDYVTWGNHEADIDHRTVCRHVRNFPGTWLNSNMQDHEAMDYQKPFDMVEITSPDGSNTRRVGLVAVLTNIAGLYSSFKPPGAFGGATIRDPWETLAELSKDLVEGKEYKCDVVIPLQHTYVPEDHKTCREFDFPVILSGHDHHRVDEVVEGTRLLKPGMDAVYATILELSWDDVSCSSNAPTVTATFARCSDWEPDPILKDENERAYDVLLPLRNTELAKIPTAFEPLSSKGSRGKVSTMGSLLCSLLHSSLNISNDLGESTVNAVLLCGGNIRGGKDYDVGSFFSLETLEAEIKSDDTVAVVDMPGWVLVDGIVATHSGKPTPGWMQYDGGVKEEYFDDGQPPIVTHVEGLPIKSDRVYRVATKISDLTNGLCEPFAEYYSTHPELLPPKGAYMNIHAELMSFCAKNLWRKIWDEISPTLTISPCAPIEGYEAEERLDILDLNDDGVVCVDDILAALRDVAEVSVHEDEQSLAQFVHSYADISGDGRITLRDFEIFCDDCSKSKSLMSGL